MGTQRRSRFPLAVFALCLAAIPQARAQAPAQSCDASSLPTGYAASIEAAGRNLASAINDYYSAHEADANRFLDPSTRAPSCAVGSGLWTNAFIPFLTNGSNRSGSGARTVSGSSTPYAISAPSAGSRLVEMANYLSLVSSTYPVGSEVDGHACTTPGETAHDTVDAGGGSSAGTRFSARGPASTVMSILHRMAARLPGAPGVSRRGGAPDLYSQCNAYLNMLATYSALTGCLPPPITIVNSSGHVLSSTAAPVAIPPSTLASHRVPDAIAGLLNGVIPGAGTVPAAGSTSTDDGGAASSTGASAE